MLGRLNKWQVLRTLLWILFATVCSGVGILLVGLGLVGAEALESIHE